MAVDRIIVGRVSEDQSNTLGAEQRRRGICVAAIPANESMAAEDPKVSRPAHSRSITLTGQDPVFGLPRPWRLATAATIEVGGPILPPFQLTMRLYDWRV